MKVELSRKTTDKERITLNNKKMVDAMKKLVKEEGWVKKQTLVYRLYTQKATS